MNMMAKPRYISLQNTAKKPDTESKITPTSLIFKSGKLISSLSQLMRQVPDKLLYTKY